MRNHLPIVTLPGAWRLSMAARAVAGLALSAAALNGCSTPPALSPQDAYLQTRKAEIDPAQPCFIDPFSTFPIKHIRNRIWVPVEVNGIQTIGVLDTGASFSLISPELAAKAGITDQTEGDRIAGIAGSFATRVGIAKTVQFGSVKALEPRRVHIFPFGGSHGVKLGVQIGIDWLDGLDYDLDVKHETITPYRVSNCATIDPPWRDHYTGVIVKHIFQTPGQNYDPFDAIFNRQISVPVVFPNGQAIEAEFDTGSTDSLLSHDAALDAGLTSSEIRADPVVSSEAIDGRPKELHVHKFAKLTLGDEDLHDFPILVEPRFDRRSTAMLLGMDYIGMHRFWISFSTGAIYIDSGKLRPPAPPFAEPRQIAGATMPEYPDDGHGLKAVVHAACMVEADGSLTGCTATLKTGPDTYRQSVLRWLASAYGPIMQPAYVNKLPVRHAHDWDITFAGK